MADTAVRFRPDAAQPFDDRYLSWQHKLLSDRTGQSDLVFRGGSFYLYTTVDQPAPTSVVPVVPVKDPVAGWVGVDLGIVNLAVTTDDDPAERDVRWSDGAVAERRTKNQVMRTALQKVGTTSAKRKSTTRDGRSNGSPPTSTINCRKQLSLRRNARTVVSR